LNEVNQIVDTPRERAMHIIRELVSGRLEGIPSKVYLIGSCARGDDKRSSDIDIAIETLQPTPKALIADIRDMLEQSDVPFFVDVFDFTQLDENYRTQIEKDGVLWIAP
jgi:predicted nucleotidyltransferase